MKSNALVVILVGLIAGSTGHSSVADSASTFIVDPPPMLSDPDRKGAKKWVKPDWKLSRYGKVALGEIEIFVSPKSSYKGISPDQLKAISEEMARSIVSKLEPRYPVVGKVGPGVLYVRIALTNVELKKKKRGLLSFTPVGLAVTAVKDAAGARTSIKNAVVQAEAIDGTTGERVAVFFDELGPSIGEREYSWDAVTEAAEYYGQRIRDRLDVAHQQ